jgi:hypothetical protein
MTVALYIYAGVSSVLDNTEIIISGFQNSVTSDGGTYEAGSCLLNEFNSLGGFSIADNTSATRVELFNDEKIVINSSVQNINDISKTYTDFSQSFTVPASQRNNKIFQHFYENAVNSSLDYNLRLPAYIEIDHVLFRTGKVQLEKAQLKNGEVDNYQITFYGDLVTLKDLLGEDKLSSLDYSAYTHIYSGANVQTRITSDATDYDLRYPLISSSRVWQVSGGGTNNITQNSGRIHYDELFPALRISKIFDAIESKYGIQFTGSFLTDKRFTDVFLYLKNKDVFQFTTDTQIIDWHQITSNDTNEVVFNLTTNTINLTYTDNFTSGDTGLYQLTLDVIPSLSAQYIIEVWVNGSLNQSIDVPTGGTYNGIVYSVDNNIGLNQTIEIKVRSTQQFDFDATINADYIYLNSSGVLQTESNSCINLLQTLTGNLDIASNMPDMKLEHFFSGVLKQFNLTCIPTSSTSYDLLPLETWYSNGTIRDITKYTDRSEISVDRLPLFKKISFEHEKSESFMNRKFYDFYAREYGDLSNTYVYDGGEYVVKLPFENLEFNKFTGSDLQVGYCLTKEPDYKPYIPKPMLLYKYDKKTVSFKFFNGSGVVTLSTYIPFGQDLLKSGVNYSLNFGSDQSTLLNQNIANGIFLVYYSAYLTNLYNNKNRMVSLKANLPVSILRNIKLNDRLIIRDKRYIINNMQIDLTTGNVQFQLISDFRNISTYIPK